MYSPLMIMVARPMGMITFGVGKNRRKQPSNGIGTIYLLPHIKGDKE